LRINPVQADFLDGALEVFELDRLGG